MAAKVKVLVAVKPPALSRVIEHLLDRRQGVEVIESVHEGTGLADRAGLRAPDLIVANVRLLGREFPARIAELKSSSPESKLILVSADQGPVLVPRLEGADAHVHEEALVERLLPVVRRLAARADSHA